MKNPLIVFFVPFLVALAFFYPTLHFAFVFDDYPHFFENIPAIKTWWQPFWHPGSASNNLYYRPWALFALRASSQLLHTPQSLHLVGWVLQALNVGSLSLFFWFCSKQRISSLVGAIVAGLIFAFHPSRIETAAWISGQIEAWLFLWIFLCFLAWAHDDQAKKNISIFLGLLFFLLALFTKETAVMIFPLLILASFFERRTKQFPKIQLASLFIVLIFYFWIRFLNLPPPSLKTGMSLDEKISQMGLAWIFYIREILAPSAYQPYIDRFHPFKFWPIWAFLTAGAFSASSVFAFRKNKKIFLGLMFFILFLIPAFSLILKGVSKNIAAVRYLYVPIAGLLFSIFIWFDGKNKKGTQMFFLAGSLLFMILEISSLVPRLSAYRDNRSFWSQAILTNPDSLYPYSQLGVMDLVEKKYDQAIIHFREALPKARPGEEQNAGETWVNLGTAYLHTGNLREAIDAYEKGYKNFPQPAVLNSLGSAYFYEAQSSKDKSYLFKSRETFLKIKNLEQFPDDFLYLGIIEEIDGNPEKAQMYYTRFSLADPSNKELIDIQRKKWVLPFKGSGPL